MRDKREVLEKFNDLYSRRLIERKRKYLCNSHMNCEHNERCRVKSEGLIGFCKNSTILIKSRRSIFVCNDEKTSEKCRLYSCRHMEESVEDDFEEILRSPSLCGKEYPKLAVLIWCLQDDAYREDRIERVKSLISSIVSSIWAVVSFRWW